MQFFRGKSFDVSQELDEIRNKLKVTLNNGAVVWRERMCENPMMTFPIKKRIHTELFIDRTAALYILESWIRDTIHKGIEPVALVGWRDKNTLC